MIAKLTFPWPPKELSPNARVHWVVKSKAKKVFQLACRAAVSRDELIAIKGCYTFRVTFCPPDKQVYDKDNCIGRWKYGQDVLSKLTGVDDSKFHQSEVIGDVVKGGAVIVEVIE